MKFLFEKFDPLGEITIHVKLEPDFTDKKVCLF